jgi:hypothetical protein
MRDRRPADSEWRQLCQVALFEFDTVKILDRIADARNAVLDRIEVGLTKPHDDEQIALREALSTLDTLHRITERQKRYQTKAS